MFSTHSSDVKILFRFISTGREAVASTAGPKMVRLKIFSLVCFSFAAISNHKNVLLSSVEERGRLESTRGCSDDGGSDGRRATAINCRGKLSFSLFHASSSSNFETSFCFLRSGVSFGRERSPMCRWGRTWYVLYQVSFGLIFLLFCFLSSSDLKSF